MRIGVNPAEEDGWWILTHPSGAWTAYRSHDRAVNSAVALGRAMPAWSATIPDG